MGLDEPFPKRIHVVLHVKFSWVGLDCQNLRIWHFYFLTSSFFMVPRTPIIWWTKMDFIRYEHGPFPEVSLCRVVTP